MVINKATVDKISAREAEGKSLWRVSSTLFGHIQSDQILEPLPPFDTAAAKKAYPSMYTGEQVAAELANINLDQTGGTVMSK